ncbi:MAG: TraR/DksA family transcriptional regulator [Candidatus Omnitrophica bacterium]|nr:TraR/DksA family transcriptional regulator [Candidatus Omnitrophota bacterium]
MKKKKLDKKTLGEFKKLLIKRKEEINEEINHIASDTLKKSQKEASGDISGYGLHMADVATDNYDREFSLGLASNERDILYRIDSSLDKIKDGSFGFCEECNKPISKTRLKAVPYAKLCIKCQESREKQV